jgi:hypothetical protein
MTLQISRGDALSQDIAESGSVVGNKLVYGRKRWSLKFVDILVASSGESRISLVVEHFTDSNITQGG